MFLRNTTRICGALSILLLMVPAFCQQTENSLCSLTVRNSTLEQRLVRTRTEQEAVATNILNSDVKGQQTTTTETRVRILPDSAGVRFEVLSIGDVSSQTTGVNPQAMIDSTGRHHFEITKPFWFNGRNFLTQPGHGTIQASQAPQRVVSAVGATMPLLRPLSDRIAWDQVNRRQAEINQAVAADVTRTVLPKVDRIVDEEFARIGQQITGMQLQVESLIGMPVNWVARSSETSLSLVATANNTKPAKPALDVGSVSLPQLTNGEEIAFAVSEDIVTAMLERYVAGGLVLTDTQIEKASRAWNHVGDEKWSIPSLLQLARDIENETSAEPTMFSIQLAKVQPVVVRFDRGDVCIETAFQIIPKVGAASGWMKTTWRMRGQGLSDDQWSVAVHRVDVGAAEDSIPVTDLENHVPPTDVLPDLRIPSGTTFAAEENAAAPEQQTYSSAEESQVTTVDSGTVWMTIVKNATQSLLKQIPPATLPKEFDSPAVIPGSPKIRLMRIESAQGTLRAAFRLVDCQPEG